MTESTGRDSFQKVKIKSEENDEDVNNVSKDFEESKRMSKNFMDHMSPRTVQPQKHKRRSITNNAEENDSKRIKFENDSNSQIMKGSLVTKDIKVESDDTNTSSTKKQICNSPVVQNEVSEKLRSKLLSSKNPLTLSPSSLINSSKAKLKHSNIVRKILPLQKIVAEKEPKGTKQTLALKNDLETSKEGLQSKTCCKNDGHEMTALSKIKFEELNNQNETSSNGCFSTPNKVQLPSTCAPADIIYRLNNKIRARNRPRPVLLVKNNFVRPYPGKNIRPTVLPNPFDRVSKETSLSANDKCVLNFNTIGVPESSSTDDTHRPTSINISENCSTSKRSIIKDTAQTKQKDDIISSIKTEPDENQSNKPSSIPVLTPSVGPNPSLATDMKAKESILLSPLITNIQLSAVKLPLTRIAPKPDNVPSRGINMVSSTDVTSSVKSGGVKPVNSTAVFTAATSGGVKTVKSTIVTTPNILNSRNLTAANSWEGTNNVNGTVQLNTTQNYLNSCSVPPVFNISIPNSITPSTTIPQIIPSSMIQTNQPITNTNLIPRFPNVPSGIRYPPPFIIPTSTTIQNSTSNNIPCFGMQNQQMILQPPQTQNLTPSLQLSGYKLGNLIIQTTPTGSSQPLTTILNPADLMDTSQKLPESMNLSVTNVPGLQTQLSKPDETINKEISKPKIESSDSHLESPTSNPDQNKNEQISKPETASSNTSHTKPGNKAITLVVPSLCGTKSTTVVVKNLNFEHKTVGRFNSVCSNQETGSENTQLLPVLSSANSETKIVRNLEADQQVLSDTSHSHTLLTTSTQGSTPGISSISSSTTTSQPMTCISSSSIENKPSSNVSSKQTNVKAAPPLSKSIPKEPLGGNTATKITGPTKSYSREKSGPPTSQKPIPADKPELKDTSLDDVLIHVKYKRVRSRNKTRYMFVYDPLWRSLIKSYIRREQNYRRVAKQLYQIPELMKELQKQFLKQLELECQHVCSPKNSASILRKKDPPDLESIRFEDVVTEVSREAPLLKSILDVVKGERCHDQNLGIMAAILLFNRQNCLSSVHHVITRILRKGGATTRTVDLLAALGLCIKSSSYTNNIHRYCEKTQNESYKSWLWLKSKRKNPFPECSDSDSESVEEKRTVISPKKPSSSPKDSPNKKVRNKAEFKHSFKSSDKQNILSPKKTKLSCSGENFQKHDISEKSSPSPKKLKSSPSSKKLKKTMILNRRFQSDVHMISNGQTDNTSLLLDVQDISNNAQISNSANYVSVNEHQELCSDSDINSDLNDTGMSDVRTRNPCAFEEMNTDCENNDVEQDDDEVLLQELSLSDYQESDEGNSSVDSDGI